jgi:hypothetical protein
VVARIVVHENFLLYCHFPHWAGVASDNDHYLLSGRLGADSGVVAAVADAGIVAVAATTVADAAASGVDHTTHVVVADADDTFDRKNHPVTTYMDFEYYTSDIDM